MRQRLPPVVGAVTQLHAWWHILTGLGSYLHILLRYFLSHFSPVNCDAVSLVWNVHNFFFSFLWWCSLQIRTTYLEYRPKVKVSTASVSFRPPSRSPRSVWCPCWETSLVLTVPLVSCGSRPRYQCVCRMNPQFLSLKRTLGHPVLDITHWSPHSSHCCDSSWIYLSSLFTALFLSENDLIIWLATHWPVCLSPCMIFLSDHLSTI